LRLLDEGSLALGVLWALSAMQHSRLDVICLLILAAVNQPLKQDYRIS
jgi:hypothetical protein